MKKIKVENIKIVHSGGKKFELPKDVKRLGRFLGINVKDVQELYPEVFV